MSRIGSWFRSETFTRVSCLMDVTGILDTRCDQLVPKELVVQVDLISPDVSHGLSDSG